MPIKKKVEKKQYEYVISDVEAAYKIFMNPDLTKRTLLKKAVKDNDGFCPNRNEQTPDNLCMCRQFRERNSEGYCKCRLYYKELRTKKQAEEYKNSEFKVDEKKEKELDKQFKKEQNVEETEE